MTKRPTEGDGQRHARDGQDGIAGEHDDDAEQDDQLVLAGAVGQDAAEQCQGVDGIIEPAIVIAGRVGGEVIPGLQKEDQDGHHGVETEAFAHVGEEGNEQPLGVILEHRRNLQV